LGSYLHIRHFFLAFHGWVWYSECLMWRYDPTLLITEQQFAVRLVLEGEVNMICSNYFMKIGWSVGPTETDLFRTQNGANHGLTGLNLFFVSSLGGINNAFHNLYGIAVEGNVTSGRVLAHEVGHACDLQDIYVEYEDEDGKISIIGEFLMDSWKMPMDWANGYHPPEMTYPEVVKRLLMYGKTDGTEVRVPKGRIYGIGLQPIGNPNNPTLIPMTGLLKVGLEDITHPPRDSLGKQN